MRSGKSRTLIWRVWHDAPRRNRSIHRVATGSWHRVQGSDVPPEALSQERRRGRSTATPSTAQVRAFLAGKGPLTQYRSHKYSTLAGFYRYAISRGHATRSPLPAPENEPKAPPSVPRHVYSHDELRRLFSAIDASRSRAFKLDAHTFRTLLLLLYGTGIAVERGNAPHDGRCRSFGRRADRAQYEVLQKPPRPGRASAPQCTESLCCPSRGTSHLGRE